MDALIWGWSDQNAREYLEAKVLEPIKRELHQYRLWFREEGSLCRIDIDSYDIYSVLKEAERSVPYVAAGLEEVWMSLGDRWSIFLRDSEKGWVSNHSIDRNAFEKAGVTAIGIAKMKVAGIPDKPLIEPEQIVPEKDVEVLATAFANRIKWQGWTIPEASRVLGIAEGTILALMKGAFDGFTTGVLHDCHRALDRSMAADTAKGSPTAPTKEMPRAWIDHLIPEGHIYQEVDGFFVFAPQKGFGAIAPWALRMIADHIDELNKPWQEELERSIAAAKASLLKKAKGIL
jgi:hypothetical protein